MNLPSGSGFFRDTNWVFDISKQKHKQLLFFKILGLTPLEMAKNGVDGKLGKKFAENTKMCPEVAVFNYINKLNSLQNNFVGSATQGLYGFSFNNEDAKIDGRIRPHFGFTVVISGRNSASKPSLQNIAQYTKEAKYIKRVLVASLGCLLLDCDAAAHEIRVWGVTYPKIKNWQVPLKKV